MADVWALKILSGPHVGAEITLDHGTWTLGRHEECDLVLTDETLAERQLELLVGTDGIQVTNLAQGQQVYIADQPQPDTFTLSPHTVAMAGSLYFAVGLVGQPWPELNLGGPAAAASSAPPPPREQAASAEPEPPVVEATAPVMEPEPVIPTVEDQVDEEELAQLQALGATDEPLTPSSPSLVTRLLNAVRGRNFNVLAWLKNHPILVGSSVFGLFMSALIGGFIWLWTVTDPEQTALDNITPAQKAENIITQMNLSDLRLRRLPDHSVAISGYVTDNIVKNTLLQALNGAQVPYSFQAVVMNEMRASAAAVLDQYQFKQMNIELDTTPGSLVLSGYASNPKEVSRIREILQQEVHGLVAIVDQVQYQATRLKTLRTMLKEKSLAQQIRLIETPGKVVLKGRLGDASQGYYLKEVVQEFRDKYKRPQLVVDVTLPATDLATMQPVLKIKSVSLGRIPYVILDNGEKYLHGAKLKNGYILEGINLEYLTLRLGQEQIKYFIGGESHGGQ